MSDQKLEPEEKIVYDDEERRRKQKEKKKEKKKKVKLEFKNKTIEKTALLKKMKIPIKKLDESVISLKEIEIDIGVINLLNI
ncbi:MAG: hypothetical protein ACTSRG_23165 [Candidatus Helarchaeota archaeon]